jgi:hypothetical protein
MKLAIPILVSCASGVVWAIIASFVAYFLSGPSTTFAGRMLSGGILAAPAIGVLIGIVSRGFLRLGRSSRIVVALGDLYLGAFLFLWTAGIEPLRGILLGLTFTGYFLVLWPLSYLNHALVAKMWNAAKLA